MAARRKPRKKPVKKLPPLREKELLAEGYGHLIVYRGKVDGGSKIQIEIQIEDKKE